MGDMFKVGGFKHRTGALPDLRELEYISALLQSEQHSLRDDATISSKDFKSYLNSRYGLEVSNETCRKIVRGLGGIKPQQQQQEQQQHQQQSIEQQDKQPLETTPTTANQNQVDSSANTTTDDDQVYLDLVQLTSILLISTLVRAKKEVEAANQTTDDPLLMITSDLLLLKQPPDTSLKLAITDPCTYLRHRQQAAKLRKQQRHKRYKDGLRPKRRRVVRDVLDIIFETLRKEKLLRSKRRQEIVTIDASLVQNILRGFGFGDKCNDDKLIDDMVQMAGGPGTVFDEVVFAHVLTSDITTTTTTTTRQSNNENHYNNNTPNYNDYLDLEDTKYSETFQDIFGFDPVSWNERHYPDHPLPGEEQTLASNGQQHHNQEQNNNTHDDININTITVITESKHSLPHHSTITEAAVTSKLFANPTASTEKDEVSDEGGAWVSFDEEDGTGGIAKVDWTGSTRKPRQQQQRGTSSSSATRNEIFPINSIDEIEVSLVNKQHPLSSSSSSDKPMTTASPTTENDEGVVVNQESARNDGDNNNNNNNIDSSSLADSKMLADNSDKDKGTVDSRDKEEPDSQYKPTAPYVDFVVDDYRSVLYTVLLWGFYVFSSAIMLRILNFSDLVNISCEAGFLCELLNQIWSWFFFGSFLALSSMVIVLPMSLGNNLYREDRRGSFVSFVITVVYSIFPFVLLEVSDSSTVPDDELTGTELLATDPGFQFQVLIYMCLGITLGLEILRTLPGIYNPKKALASSTRSGALMKQAATRKLNDLVRNAHDMHYSSECTGRSALENFIIHGMKSEETGGLIWSWKRWRSTELIKNDGIWLPINLHVGQVSQVTTLVFTIIISFFETIEYIQSTRETRAEWEAEPPGPLKDYALYTTPEPWMIAYSFFPGLAAALTVGICIIGLYVPSTIASIMKLRSGQFETLRNPKFNELYRHAADSICYNVGFMIFTMLGSAILYFIIVAGVLFLIFWPPTHDIMIVLIGWGLGLGITIGIKVLLTMQLRSEYQEAFYRKQPKKANFVMLALECWNIGLAAGTISGRLIQFLFAAAFWVGRIDTKFLDDDVKLFGYSFDYTPFNYTKDLLAHEAHRHPWIDRLGGMCLMRLKHGKRFGSDAGACWRQIFVVALMPWMLKYRKRPSIQSEEDEVQHLVANATTPDAIATVQKKLVRVLKKYTLKKKPHDVPDSKDSDMSLKKSDPIKQKTTDPPASRVSDHFAEF